MGTGWRLFAAIMLGCAAALNLIDGVVALSKSAFFVGDAEYVFSDLRTWGWILLGFGVVQALAALALTTRSQAARWFAIAVAAVNAVVQLTWIQAYPFWSLTLFALDILVIYGLVVYGGRHDPDRI
ncbi:MAG TPA: hypothetical protein VFX13_16655 [Gaiellales bacterium]|nr:hypothetical protein [Gaiellales bacterium]